MAMECVSLPETHGAPVPTGARGTVDVTGEGETMGGEEPVAGAYR